MIFQLREKNKLTKGRELKVKHPKRQSPSTMPEQPTAKGVPGFQERQQRKKFRASLPTHVYDTHSICVYVYTSVQHGAHTSRDLILRLENVVTTLRKPAKKKV